MMHEFLALTSLIAFRSFALPPDRFVVKVHLPNIQTDCELHLTRNTDSLAWANVPSHWVRFVPLKSDRTPPEWETDPIQIRIFEEVDQLRMNQAAFTLVPVGLKNTYKHLPGQILRAMLGKVKALPSPQLHRRVQKFFKSLSPEDQHLIRESVKVLKSGADGEVLSLKFLIQYQDGRLQPSSSGIKIILPDRTDPRGVMVMPFLHSPVQDFLINLHMGGNESGGWGHHYAVLPVTVEKF